MYRIEPKPVPAFELSVIGSERKVSDKDTAGKLVVLNLWTTWCGPCVKEMPEFQKFYEKHAKDTGLALFAVNAAEPPATVRKFLQDKPYTFPVLLDPKAFDRFGIDGIPSTFVADATGRIRFHMMGYNPDADFVQELEWLIEAVSSREKAQ